MGPTQKSDNVQIFSTNDQNHKCPKKQGIVATNSGHERVRVRWSSTCGSASCPATSRWGSTCPSIRAGRRPTASVDAALQNYSALCSRARMFMLHALYLLWRGFEHFSGGILDVRLARWFLSSLCVVFVRAFLCRATVRVGGCRVGPAWVSDAESLPWIPRK